MWFARLFEVGRVWKRKWAIMRLRKLRRRLPPGFIFDREEANSL
jgi:hypothetical protein